MDDSLSAAVKPVRSAERRTLQVSCAVFASGALVLLFDFWPWILLSLWTASVTGSLASGLERRIRGRKRAAALVTVGILLALLVPIGAGVAVVIPDVIELAQRARGAESGEKTLIELVSTRAPAPEDEAPKDGAEQAPEAEPEDPPAPDAEQAPAPKATEVLSAKPAQIVDMVKQHGKQAMTIGGVVASTLGSFALGVFLFFVGTYAALVHGDAAYRWLRERLPLSAASTDRLRDTYQETGRGLLYSVGLTALLQGGLATIAYVSLGVPRAFALGLATIITSLIPAIGPFLVWGPVAVGLFLAEHPIKAGILVAVGLLVVAPADNVLRPLLAQRGHLKLHPFLVFFSMVGAISLIGGWGLVIGPLVFRMARELIDMVHAQRAATSEA